MCFNSPESTGEGNNGDQTKKEIIAYTGCYSSVESKNLYNVFQHEQYFTRRQITGIFFRGWRKEGYACDVRLAVRAHTDQTRVLLCFF